MSANQKQIQISQRIAEQLGLRQSTLAVLESTDTSGNPTIRLGTGVAKSPGAFIRVIKQDWPEAKDIFGNTARIYAPSKVQVALEANAQQGGADEDDVNTWAVLLPVIGLAVQSGARVEIFLSATGTFPVVGSITGAPVAEFDAQIEHGMIGNV